MHEQTDIETRLKSAVIHTSSEFDQRVLHDVARLMPDVETSTAIDWKRDRKRIASRVGWLATASAVALVLMVTAVWLNGRDAHAAFAEVQTQVAKARSVKYRFRAVKARMTFNVIADQRKGYRMKVTLPDGSLMEVVYSAEHNQVLVLQPGIKHARVINPKDDETKMFKSLGELLSQFQTLESNAEQRLRLGEKEIDNRPVTGFRVKRPHPGDAINSPPLTHWIVWVDTKTRLPVRIECASSWDEAPLGIMTDFECDTKIDKSTFDTTPPAGWKVKRDPERETAQRVPYGLRTGAAQVKSSYLSATSSPTIPSIPGATCSSTDDCLNLLSRVAKNSRRDSEDRQAGN